MAGAMSRACPSRLIAGWIAAALGAAASAAGIADPTQPPPGYGVSQRATDAGSENSTPTPEPVRLQMVAHDGSAHIAVVNGQRVRPGEAITLDGKRVKVVAIRDDSIVLERDGQRQMVELTPHVRLK
jgi:hypothetical protein